MINLLLLSRARLRRFVTRASACAAGLTLATASLLAQTVRLSDPPAFPEFSGGVNTDFIFTPDGSRVIFSGELTIDDKFSLYSVPTDGSGPQVLLSDAFADTNVIRSYAVTPDGTRVVYSQLIRSSNRHDIFGASATTAGTQIQLVQNVAANGVLEIVVTTDGTKAVTRTNELNSAVLSFSPTVPQTPIRLNAPIVSGGAIDTFKVVSTSTGNRVVYSGDLETNNVIEIFSAAVDTANSQIKLNTIPPAGGDVDANFLSEFDVTPDGNFAFYTGDLVVDQRFELYRASTTAAGTQLTFSSTANAESDALGFRINSDGASVFAIGDLIDDDTFELYRYSTTLPPNQTTVYRPAIDYTGVRALELTPDGQNVVFRGALTAPNRFELYIAPTTFLIEPRRLTTLTGSADVESFVLSPDGTFAVYYQREGSTNSLWAVSTSGNFAPVKIAPPTGESLDPRSYQISPDNSRVVYVQSPGLNVPEILLSVVVPPLNGTPNPNPAVPVGTTPPTNPPSGAVPPSIAIATSKKIKTTRNRVVIKGTATDDTAVSSVLLTYQKVKPNGKKKNVTKRAKLIGDDWKLKYRPRQKRTKFSAVAVDSTGLRSTILRVKVIKN